MKKKLSIVFLIIALVLVVFVCLVRCSKNDTVEASFETGSFELEENTEETTGTEESKTNENKETEASKNPEASKESEQESEASKEPEESKEPEASKENKDEIEVTAVNKTMYATQSVNVRKGPSTEYDKLGTLSKDEEVHVTGQAKNGWFRFDYNGGNAFVSNNYLTETKPVKEPVQPSTPAPEPSQPSEPEQPAQPEQPEAPSQPSEPEQPAQPSEPEQPSQPSEPEQPTQPTQPEQPSSPNPATCDHDYVFSYWFPAAPTCAADGSAIHHCSKCGDPKTVHYEPTGQHDFQNPVETVPGDCLTPSEITYYCSVCGGEEHRVGTINPNNHPFDVVDGCCAGCWAEIE